MSLLFSLLYAYPPAMLFMSPPHLEYTYSVLVCPRRRIARCACGSTRALCRRPARRSGRCARTSTSASSSARTPSRATTCASPLVHLPFTLLSVPLPLACVYETRSRCCCRLASSSAAFCSFGECSDAARGSRLESAWVPSPDPICHRR